MPKPDAASPARPTGYKLLLNNFFDHGDLSFDVARDGQRSKAATGQLSFTATATSTQIPITNDANGPTGTGTVSFLLAAGSGSEITGYTIVVTGAQLAGNGSQFVSGNTAANVLQLDQSKLTLKAQPTGAVTLPLAQLTNDGKFSVVITPMGQDGKAVASAKKTLEFTAKALPKSG